MRNAASRGHSGGNAASSFNGDGSHLELLSTLRQHTSSSKVPEVCKFIHSKLHLPSKTEIGSSSAEESAGPIVVFTWYRETAYTLCGALVDMDVSVGRSQDSCSVTRVAVLTGDQ